MKILILSGSLREKSSSHAVINTVTVMAPSHVSFIEYKEIGSLPHFNTIDEAPEIVQNFRKQITEADGVFICTPEYAYGAPGSLKNALDWTVASGDFYNKPVALVTASSGGEYAHASLLLTLSALGAKVDKEATLIISSIRAKINEHGKVKEDETLEKLKQVLDAFIKSISIT